MEDKNTKLNVIYISGLGRSGSTLVDMLISTNSKVFSVGEIYRFDLISENDPLCACGKQFSNCEFWNKFDKNEVHMVNHYNFRDYLGMLLYLINPFQSTIKLGQTSNNHEFFNKVLEHSSGEVKYILDSSKDPVRLMELDADPRIDVKNVTVRRDGRGAASSFAFRKFNYSKSFFVTIFKWIFINLCLSVYELKRGDKSYQLSYEKLCQNPEQELRKLSNFLDLEIAGNYAEVIRRMNYHNIGGNPAAHVEKRQEFTPISIRNSWQKLDPIRKILGSVITYPFNRWWVYRD